MKYPVIIIVVLLVGLLAWTPIQQIRQASQRAETKKRLRQLMVAMHAYHDDFESFPPAYTLGPDGKRWHSWRALLLPYVDMEMAKAYRLDEPWDGPNNSTLQKAPDVFQSPLRDTPESGTNFFAVIGRNTMWPAYQATRIREITCGTSNTIAIVEAPGASVGWLEPEDTSVGRFCKSFYADNVGRDVAMADGSVRFLSATLGQHLMTSLLAASPTDNTFEGDDWPAEFLEAVPDQKFGSVRPAGSLPGTDVVPVPTMPLNAERDQVWSASFQLAWAQLNDVASGRVTAKDNDLVSQLNSFHLPPNTLSEAATFNGATDGSAELDREITSELHQRFPDVNYEPAAVGTPTDGLRLRVVSAIRKNMPFEGAFDRFPDALRFGVAGDTVESFGCRPVSGGDTAGVFVDQLKVLDDGGDKDVIVSLQTVGQERDSILLAMIEPQGSLDETWRSALERITNPNPQHSRVTLEGNETLRIPILDFSLQTRFDELEGVSIEEFDDDARIDLALQYIRLRLDETGAEFVSLSELGIIVEFGEPAYDPERVRSFVFDQPFLIAIREVGSEHPWFLAWIANLELMEIHGAR